MKLQGIENMMKEIGILSNLQHPNIVRFIGVKQHQGEQYMVMEFMNSGSLLDYIRKNEDRLHVSKFFEMAHQISLGMSYLEEKKIVHK